MNPKTKIWLVKYRPFYEHWVMLLRTVDPLIYAPTRQKIIPQPIQAQYERELPQSPMNFTSGFMTSRTGISEIIKSSMVPKVKYEVVLY